MTFETDLLAHYSAVRRRLRQGPAPAPVALAEPEAEVVPAEPEPDEPSPPPEPPPPVLAQRAPIRAIIAIVAREYGLTAADIYSSRCFRTITPARHLAAYLSRQLTTLSFPEIGRRMGGRDHTTVLNSTRRVSASLGEPLPITPATTLIDFVRAHREALSTPRAAA